eukprot:TRINITY_DN19508_c0_g1_i1.p1 TRINITY_DN19508_c0_g1~~TRINITY_DN19508_c0_g1_i1.p1  ORF type:complete len:210 (-),score=62.80 TRINITY_DN19508_c0_g1_i1:151-780(-)
MTIKKFAQDENVYVLKGGTNKKYMMGILSFSLLLVAAAGFGIYWRVTHLEEGAHWTDMRKDPPLIIGTLLFFAGLLPTTVEWRTVTIDRKQKKIIFFNKSIYSFLTFWPDFHHPPIAFVDIDKVILQQDELRRVIDKRRLAVKKRSGVVVPLDRHYMMSSPELQKTLDEINAFISQAVAEAQDPATIQKEEERAAVAKAVAFGQTPAQK